MKLRSLLLLIAGIALGMKLAGKLREDDPNVVHGPQRTRSDQRPTLRVVSTQVQRLTDQLRHEPGQMTIRQPLVPTTAASTRSDQDRTVETSSRCPRLVNDRAPRPKRY